MLVDDGEKCLVELGDILRCNGRFNAMRQIEPGNDNLLAVTTQIVPEPFAQGGQQLLLQRSPEFRGAKRLIGQLRKLSSRIICWVDSSLSFSHT